MLEKIHQFFDTTEFMPHGHCFLWYPQILWLHVVSDALIAAAYFSIPLSLFYFTRRRTDAPFQFLFYLFGAFILLCGTTHLMGIWVIWNPDYAVEGVIKAFTAVASIVTAYLAWKIMPLALLLKTPKELERVNARLEHAYAEIEQKVIERTHELRTLSEQLQKEVNDREIINAKLQLALEEAEQASKAKSEFLANMSHEIRTPMNAVVGLVYLLQNPNLTEEKRKEFIRTIQLSSQALMDLLNDLLDITKLESDGVKLENVSFNLAELAEEIISIMSVKAKEKGLELFVQYDKSLNENFMGDPLRLRQVLMNLVTNAIKFTEKGTVTVHVEASQHQNNGLTNVGIDVTDTGIGIAAEKQESIFSKFSQADTSITRKYGGTGLGLSICKMLVELMGGKISVVSSVGLGSKFSFNVPLYHSEIIHPRKDRNPKFGGSDTSPAIAETQSCVLLVEDYKANILVATSTIEHYGYKWELAENGAEALEMFKNKTYDLVLMDVQMPEMDGLTATRAMREHETQHQKPRTPILGVTAFSQAKDREKCINAGMDDFLSKPFNAEELKEKMSGLLMNKEHQ